MASLSNINGIFDVHSTGAILFSTSHGTSGQILKSNGNAAPTWIPQSDIVGAYLPLAGGTLTGATATASGISFTVGGTLTVGGNNVVGFSGSWNGANMPGSRWNGYSVNGGEIVFQRDNPNSGQMSILVDGGYYAGENNGFYSLYSSNSYNSKAGFNADSNGTLQFNGDVQAPGLYIGARNASFDFYNNGTSYFNGAVTVDAAFTQSGGAASTFSGSVTVNTSNSNIFTLNRSTSAGGYMVFRNNNADKLYIGSRGTVSGSGGTGYDIYAVGGNDIRFFPGTLKTLTLDTSAKATFTGDVEIAANLFSTGNNLKFHAAGTHVMNIDVNGKVYPNVNNAYDLGHSTSLAWRDLYLSGTANIPTIAGNTNFTGDIYQYGSTFRTSSFINLLNNINTKKYLETAYFTNGVSNQAVNIQFINAAHQGFYKITLSGSYSNQDISGKLTKVIPYYSYIQTYKHW